MSEELSNVRILTENIEKQTLSPYACLASSTKGRAIQEEPCILRTDFQRDRDRITHCKSFRRLMHKTQVFLSPEGDHYRTRLTHTLEVAQIARTIARALRLNEDLTEAICLGHDLGHTPFGHAGEKELNNILKDGFRHFEHSVRVVEVLEKNGKGLNLCFETLDGIFRHTGGKEAETSEGKIVRFADKIAYINHDIDDAISAKVIKNEDIPKDIIRVLGETKTKRITSLVLSLIQNSQDGNIKMDDETYKAYKDLHSFMYERVYLNPYAKAEEKKVPRVIQSLYSHFLNPDNLPSDMQKIAEIYGNEQAAADFIAGMTDRYAIDYYEDLYIPKSWNIGM